MSGILKDALTPQHTAEADVRHLVADALTVGELHVHLADLLAAPTKDKEEGQD